MNTDQQTGRWTSKKMQKRSPGARGPLRRTMRTRQGAAPGVGDRAATGPAVIDTTAKKTSSWRQTEAWLAALGA